MKDGEQSFSNYEFGKLLNTSVREHTEGDETTPTGKKVASNAVKSNSLTSRFNFHSSLENK